MSDFEIHQFSCLQDNFGVLIHEPDSGLTASIDAPEAEAIKKALEDTGWRLSHILITHHHHDHTGGNLALKSETGCRILGPGKNASSIPGLDETLKEGDCVQIGAHEAEIIATPGHTSDHISYFFKEAKVAFTGDTLFAMGCGRLFEEPAEVMWESLKKIKALPTDTQIYCGHEYTLANAEFALTIDPKNEALQARAREVRALRKTGAPTLPTSLQVELDTNPFLRAGDPDICERLAMEGRKDWEVFAEIRRRKDRA